LNNPVLHYITKKIFFMKKLLLSLTILLIVYGCNPKKEEPSKDTGKQTTETAQGVILNQYIVFMKDSFGIPLIKSTGSDTSGLIQKRSVFINKLKGYFEGKGINVEEKNIFVDVSVGAVVNINPDTVKILLKDTLYIDNIIQDVKIDINDVDISINPIQQTDPSSSGDPLKQWLSDRVPAAQINPIQQSPAQLTRYDIHEEDHITKAISTAGGPVPWNPATNKRKIWFLDTGIDTDNPNLNVRISLGISIIGGSSDDDNGHGTFCAGIAAGRPVGSSPGLAQIHYGLSEGAPVVPVKVLDQQGVGQMSNVFLGLDYVAKHDSATRGDIVNLSLGAYDIGNSYDPRRDECFAPNLRIVIQNLSTSKGIFVTMAAGNNGGNAKSNLPGCINGGKIFTVSSLNADLTCAEYANFNVGIPPAHPVDFVTIGTRVFSLWSNGDFRMASGTSASSALVAGIIHVRGGEPTFSQRIPCSGGSYKLAKR
jgi:hypothetical protein